MNDFFIGFNTASSKNGGTSSHGIAYKSKQTQAWLKAAEHQFHLQRLKFIEATKDLPRPLHVKFTFIRKSKHKFDYINPLQTMQDAMQEFGWLPDDNSDEIKPYFGDYIYDKEHSGCLIHVYKTKPLL